MRSASVGVLAALGILAAWLVAAAGIGFDGSPAPRAGPQPVVQPDPVLSRLEAQTSRLRGYLSNPPALSASTRDPFRFGTRPVARPTLPGGSMRPAPPADTVPQPAAEPIPLTLAGVAEDGPPDSPLRVAVISGMGQLFLVKEGQEFGGRFRVVRIGPDAAAVTDRATGKTATLALK